MHSQGTGGVHQAEETGLESQGRGVSDSKEFHVFLSFLLYDSTTRLYCICVIFIANSKY